MVASLSPGFSLAGSAFGFVGSRDALCSGSTGSGRFGSTGIALLRLNISLARASPFMASRLEGANSSAC